MIEVDHLTKLFDRKIAVDDVSFTVQRGEVLGFLGPNGAGKSTTMRMITGFLPPSSGTARIGGADILTSPLQAREKFGYLPENAPTYQEMTVMGFLDFIADIRGLSGKHKTEQIEKTIARCHLAEVRHQMVGTLSKGYNQRVCFAQCILHDPAYLIMDEPTDGLDPNQKHEVRNMIREMARDKAVILSTHNLEEADAVCTRVIIIADGKIRADDTPTGLKTRSSVHGAVRFSIESSKKAAMLEGCRSIANVASVELLSETGPELSIRVFPQDKSISLAQDIIRYFKKHDTPVKNLFVEAGRLEEVFRDITLSHA
ncbi:MAG: ATP-binding cassette domain-containing protein [Deltaproteobacteria bacterium]|nr:ATP-binding cassette domain-containing protein [Deltaproteobacteria bacterium]